MRAGTVLLPKHPAVVHWMTCLCSRMMDDGKWETDGMCLIQTALRPQGLASSAHNPSSGPVRPRLSRAPAPADLGDQRARRNYHGRSDTGEADARKVGVSLWCRDSTGGGFPL